MSEEPTVLVAVEDDPAFQVLIEAALSGDPELEVFGDMAVTVDDALRLAREVGPRLIILDHNLGGEMVGIATAPRLKEAAPGAKILLFSAYDVGAQARREQAVDAFLRKDDVEDLLPLSRRLLGLDR